MIHFDIDGRHQDELVVGSAIWGKDDGPFLQLFRTLALGYAVAQIAWVTAVILLLLFATQVSRLERFVPEREPPPRDEERFVYIEPLNRIPEQLREQLDLSDLDRRAQTPERAPEPENTMPFSTGNTPERVIPSPPPQVAESGNTELLGPDDPAELAEAMPVEPPPQPRPEQQIARNTPPFVPQPQVDATRPRRGVLGEALRDLSKYTENQTEIFENPQGGEAEPGAWIDFDSKGIDFGPWLRRFVSQVKRNWFVPLAARTFRGRVVLQFNVHRDGRITDLRVVKPSNIDAFTLAAHNAILGSNPTEPLPPEYPDDRVLFTVTFFYNETPP